MKIIIVDNGSKHIKAIEKICRKHGRTEVLSFDNLEQVVDDKNTMLVLSGGHSYPVKYNHELYAKEMALIKNSKMPIIGICLGFELIAECYGASLKLRKRRLHRLVRIHKTHQDPAIAGLESVLNITIMLEDRLSGDIPVLNIAFRSPYNTMQIGNIASRTQPQTIIVLYPVFTFLSVMISPP